MTAAEMNLKEYVEGRFDRLAIAMDDKFKTLKSEIVSLIDSNDLRYQQRFEAQGKELDKAFSAAKEAVSSALVANDKASVKTELSADKRFEDLGELIKEQFKGMVEKLDSAIKRVDTLDGRVNLISGESAGKTATWKYVAATIGILLGVPGVVLIIVHLFKPS